MSSISQDIQDDDDDDDDEISENEEGKDYVQEQSKKIISDDKMISKTNIEIQIEN